jgi:N-dimethylarginine dimethylaminohydrolase
VPVHPALTIAERQFVCQVLLLYLPNINAEHTIILDILNLMSASINRTVLMSGPANFADTGLNPYSDASTHPDITIATQEFQSIKSALESIGVKVIKVDEPENCQDGIFTANWALCRGDTAILSSLPPQRASEQPYADQILQKLGKRTIPAPYHFSGQGDSLPCGNLLFAGSGYRTDPRMHKFVSDTLNYEVISLEAIPLLDDSGQPAVNKISGWSESFFYDIDLAISILAPGLIAWCPEAFTQSSQLKIRQCKIDKIEVSLEEAKNHFACNLVSSGETVVMSAEAPRLKSAIEARGLKTITPPIKELLKGGGYIRCTTLTLDNV